MWYGFEMSLRSLGGGGCAVFVPDVISSVRPLEPAGLDSSHSQPLSRGFKWLVVAAAM